jgi:P27 family predicted phage terminase small subunit
MPAVGPFDPNDVILPASLTPSQEKRVAQILDMIVSTGSAGYTDTMTVGTLIKVMLALDDVDEQLNVEGYLIEYENTRGVMVQKVHPAFDVRKTLFREMRSLLSEFGLSPMTRRGLVRLAQDDDEDTDEWDGLLN